MSKFFLRLAIILSLVLIVGLSLRNIYGADFFLEDINGMGWFIGVLGTIYTLIAAFIVVEVWSQFNGISGVLAREAKTLASIWDFTDYLNDAKTSGRMKKALLDYISAASGREKEEAAKKIRSVHPSKELTAILKVLDNVKFDDERDASVFPLVAKAYEDLSTVRGERIEAGVTRLPPFLKSLFLLLSLILLLSFTMLGFVHTNLYIFSLLGASIIVGSAFLITDDMDNPFEGFWNIDYKAFEQAKDYISKSSHKN